MKKIKKINTQRLGAATALAAIMALSLVVGGCVKLEKPAVSKRYYNIQPERTQAPALGEPLARGNLRVMRLKVSPRYSGREMVYKTRQGLFESDFYNAFFIPPADMLTQDLLAWLEPAGLYAHVVDPSSLADASHTLEGVVNELYGDYSQTPPRAVVRMQFFLMDENAFGEVIILSRDYDRVTPIPDNDPKALVAAMQKSVGEIFGELEGDLRTFLTTK